MHLSVSLRGEQGDGLWLHLRECADNLLSCNVVVRAAGFQASYETEVYGEEVALLYQQLVHVSQKVAGTVSFTNDLHGLELALALDDTGLVNVKGTARDVFRGNGLHFTFRTDRSYLAEMVLQLDEVLQALKS